MLYSGRMPIRNIKFHIYTIHGHLEKGIPDYSHLFRAMTRLRGHRQEKGRRQIVVGTAELVGDYLFLVMYSGDSRKKKLLFDLNEQQELTQPVTLSRFYARKTRAMISLSKRRLLIEVGKGTVSADALAQIIEDDARELAEFETLELTFTPVVAPDFVKEIDQLTRIQSATVTVARPNVDWTDRYSVLTALASESQAKAIDTTVRARRGATISKESGLVGGIKTWVKGITTSIKGARIKGEMKGSSGLITLDLSDHVERVDIPVEVSPEIEEPTDEVVEQRLISYFRDKEK